MCFHTLSHYNQAILRSKAEEMKKQGAGNDEVLRSDHPENPINFLTAGAAYCHKYGLPKNEALKAVTITAAELGGFADRTGSVTPGKDADLVLLDNDPFDLMTNVCMTMINGKIEFERI